MNNKAKLTMLFAVGLASLPIISAPAARADSAYPTQGNQSFHASGVVTMVDADRDRVTIKTSDGTQYNLDTDDTSIKLRDSDRPGDTSDLVIGMHVDVSGRLLSADIVAADHMTVLSIDNSAPADQTPPDVPSDDNSNPPPPVDNNPPAPAEAPMPEPGPSAPPTPSGHGQRIKLRGTVENVDDDSGDVVVRVNMHERTIVVTHDTDLTDIASADDSHIGLRSGDRITVVGVLTPDGTIRASAISLSQNIAAAEHAAAEHASADGVPMAPPISDGVPMAPPIDTPNQLVGRIVQSADAFSRDITIRLDSGRHITVHVPHEARVLRNGVPISVHDLTGDDVVRIVGGYDGGEFKVERIEVLGFYN